MKLIDQDLIHVLVHVLFQFILKFFFDNIDNILPQLKIFGPGRAKFTISSMCLIGHSENFLIKRSMLNVQIAAECT